MSLGLVHVYTGAGKGKTTAALGLLLRAAGRGIPAVLVQFLKGGQSGELAALERLPGVTVLRGKSGSAFAAAMSPRTAPPPGRSTTAASGRPSGWPGPGPAACWCWTR